MPLRKAEPFVVACIPAFNEERNIGGVVVRAERYVDRVLVCDDGSTDMSGVIAEALGADVVLRETNRVRPSIPTVRRVWSA